MDFKIPYLVLSLFLFFKCNKGSGESCTSDTHMFDKDVNKCCKKCPPGYRLKTKCSQQTETVCEACPTGKWSKGYSYHTNCFKCTKCESEKGLMYFRNCSTTMDAKCVCKPEKYCIMGYKEPYCSDCKSYIQCKPGDGVTLAGTAIRNVKCGPCPSGTFSGQRSSTEKCRPHSTCGSQSIRWEGNSTSDTVCVPVTREATTTRSTTLRPTTTQPTTDLTSVLTLSTLTVPASVSAVHSISTQSTTTVIATLLAVAGAGLIMFIVIAVYCLRRKQRSPEKETKVTNVETGILTSTSHPECQFLLNHSGRAKPTALSPDRPSIRPSSGPSSGPSVGNGVSNCYVNQDETCSDHPQSPTVHQVVNVNVNIVASAPAASLAPSSCSTPRPNGRPPDPDSDLPLSQEEEDISSCQVEQGKETHTAVPETGWEGREYIPKTRE